MRKLVIKWVLPVRAENKDFRLIGHLCASRFPSWFNYCSFMPGQITNLTGQKAILFGICLMAFVPWPPFYFRFCR